MRKEISYNVYLFNNKLYCVQIKNQLGYTFRLLIGNVQYGTSTAVSMHVPETNNEQWM